MFVSEARNSLNDDETFYESSLSPEFWFIEQVETPVPIFHKLTKQFKIILEASIQIS